MSEASLRAAGLPLLSAILTAIAWPATGYGQESAMTVDELEAALTELIVERDAAIATARAADSTFMAGLADPTAQIDSVRVGPLWLIARSEDLAELERMADDAWRPFERSLGGYVPAELDGFRMTLQLRGRPRAASLAGDGGTFLDRGDSREKQVEQIAKVISGRVAPSIGTGLRWWAGITNLRVDREALLQDAYRSLVFTPSRAASGCFDGNLDDCWRAMGLLDGGSWWSSWFAPEELVARFRGHHRISVSTSMRDTRDACVMDGEYEACVAVAKNRLPMGRPSEAPLPPTARQSLLLHVLDRGGEAAWASLAEMSPERIVDEARRDDPGWEPFPDRGAGHRARLVRASGMSEHELIRSWREAVLAARPDVATDTLRTGLQTGVWILLLLGLSLRSTRWRRD